MIEPDHGVLEEEETALLLRTCNPDMTSYGGFVWPKSGHVEAPDWNPNPMCGGGLHGLLNGQGQPDLLDWSPDAVWQVVECDPEVVVALGGKVKIPSGHVVFSGSRSDAAEYMRVRLGYPAHDNPIVGGTATAGYGGTATAGHYGSATAGDMGHATAGYRGSATVGDWGTTTVGDGGTATAGNYGTATAGNYGHATAGYRGSATVGDGGTATAGDGGTATAGYGGTVTAGADGVIVASWFGGKPYRQRIAVGYIGEDGLVPGQKYAVDVNGRWVHADKMEVI